MSAKLQLSSGNFFRRIKSLYTHWKDTQKEFSNIDAICILNGKDEDSAKIKTTAIYVWLFGYELLDSLLFFTKKTIILLASERHISYLDHFHNEKGSFEYDFVVLKKEEANNSSNFDKIKEILQKDSEADKPKVGRLLKEKQVSPFSAEVDTFVQSLNPDLVEVGPLVQDTLCVKESEELELVKKAGLIAVWMEDKVIQEVENIIDSEAKKKHSEISKKMEEFLENAKEIQQLEQKLKIEKQFIDIAYTPIVQSGGAYDLRPQAESTNENLSYDTVICSVGMKYHEYNCNVVRTLFIDPDTEQRANYIICHELQNLIIGKLKPGASLKSVYESGIEFVKGKKEELLSKLPPNLGFGIGLEFREQNLGINSKNEKSIEAGMVFNIAISFSNLKSKNGKDYAIMIGDTVIVRPNGPEVLTAKISRKYEEISYALQEDEAPEEKKTNNTGSKNKQTTTSKRNRDGQKVEHDESKRGDHQKRLREQKLQELEERFSSGNNYGEKGKMKIETEKLVAYRNQDALPKEIKKNQVYVDTKNDCIVVPIFGQMVPFHINVIKNVNKQEEDKRIAALRLNFHIPVATASTITFPELTDPDTLFIRELTFKSRNIKNITEVIKKIKDLQKKVKDKQTEEREKNSNFNPDEDPLVIIKGKRPMLSDLKVRPNISGKKTNGNLEAHANGFRFSTKKNEKIDITFKNIKHAFYQPCDNEMIILIHFNLHKPILIGKKRSYDVQFYTEAGLQAEDLDVRRRVNDDDEYEQEEREKAQRKKLNDEFRSFTKAVEAAARDQIEFDIPYRELAFEGAPFKSSVKLYPTVHCLVNLTETPFYIMTLDEVEIAHFERVQYGLRNFDLNFVYKDYSKPVTRICAIPAGYLDPIKTWLDKIDIIFSESVVNLDWNKILNEVRTQIREDYKNFVEEGGWDFLQPSGSQDGGSQGSLMDDDSVFSVDDGEDEESESEISDDDEDADEDDDDEDESEFDEEELDEEGLSWDEMEEIAEKEDAMKKRTMGMGVVPSKGMVPSRGMIPNKKPPPAKGGVPQKKMKR